MPTYFDNAIREALESILGGPCPDWSWLKASLPSSRGGLNLRSASLHAPAAFIGSFCGSMNLVEEILGITPNVTQAFSALSSSAARPYWHQLDDIDMPLHQCHLSLAIDEVFYMHLLSSAPTTRPR